MIRYVTFFATLLFLFFSAAVFVWSVDYAAWRWVSAGSGFSCMLFLALELGKKVHAP